MAVTVMMPGAHMIVQLPVVCMTEGTALGAEGIVDAVRFEGASGSEEIGRRIRIKRIGAQIAEIFGVDRGTSSDRSTCALLQSFKYRNPRAHNSDTTDSRHL